MKKLITLLFVLSTTFLFAQSTDEIVKSHIDAVGGKDNWAKVKSIRMESTIKSQGSEIKVVVSQVDKKEMRQDILVMGMSGYNIVKVSEGWNYMPWQGQTKAEAMTPDDLKNSQDDLYLSDDFITYKEQEKKLDFFGKDDVDGTECYKFKLTDKNGQETTYYLDPSNYFVIKQTQKMKANGQELENSTFYSDYKKQEIGVFFPMSIRGDWGEVEVTKLEVNPQLDEAIFTPSN